MRYFYRIIIGFLFVVLLCVSTHARIVFDSKRTDGKTRHIYMMDDNGRNVRRITDPSFHDRMPNWFPDGKRILFERDLTRGSPIRRNAEFYILDLESGRERRFMENHHTDSAPALSPDGKQLVFDSLRDGKYDLYVFNFESGEVKNLTKNGDHSASYYADWSPDSKKIVYSNEGVDGHTIWIMNADGSRKHQVTPRRLPQFFLGRPSWSPSGKYIMYSEQEREPDFLKPPVAMRLMILNVQTGGIKVHDFPRETVFSSFSCWMGDDRTVLLSMNEDWRDETAYYDIYRYDLVSQKLTNLTKQPKGDYDPRWISDKVLPVSPVGKQPMQWGKLKKAIQSRGVAFKVFSQSLLLLCRLSVVFRLYHFYMII